MTTKTTTQLMRHAIRLYSCDMAPKRTNRHNQRQWLRSVSLLGSNWVYATQVQRLAK